MNPSEIRKPGIHFITEPIKLSSGTRLVAESGSRLVGGVRLEIDEIQGNICICDLKRAGIEPGRFASRGFGRSIVPSHSELFINGAPMSISRYPRDGFLKITAVGEATSNEWKRPVGRLDGGFFYEDEHPKTWKPQELWTFGYWAYDWSPTRERVDLLDTERGFIKNAPPYGQYSYIPGQRFCFFNIIEEVSEPGDYAIDFENGRIYFVLPEGAEPESAEIFLSMSDQPAFLIEDAEDICIEGFRIEAFRHNAVKINRAKNVFITDCEIRNIGTRAIVVDDSHNVIIDKCRIHDTGDAGVAIWSGNRKTLERGDCGVRGCEIYRVAAWDRCYEPPIKLTGVGLFARDNLLHDCPHTAVLYGGNDIEITGNEIYRVVLETGDAGAIYAGRDYTMRGNLVARNFIHHVGSGIGMGTMGVYNDDCLSGTMMIGNTFFKVQRALFLGGGVDFVCEGNVFVDCTPSIEIDGRGQSDHNVWRNMVINTLHDRFYNIENSGLSAIEAPYIDRYPELARIDEYYKADREPHIPPSAVMKNNIFCSEQKIKYTWNTDGGSFIEENNLDISRDELRGCISKRAAEVIFAEE